MQINTPTCIIDLLTEAQTSSAVALIDGDKSLTYSDLFEQVRHFGAYLNHYFPPGSRIGIATPNSRWSVISLFAITYAGLVIVPIDYGSHPVTVATLVTACDIRAIVTVPQIQARISPQLNGSCDFILIDESLDARPSVRSAISEGSTLSPPTRATHTDELAMIMYTTGTTGNKKGVMLSHRNLLQSARNIIEFMGITPPLIECIPMPLSHSFGFARLRVVLMLGGTVVIENGLLNPERLLSQIIKTGTNALSMVPSAFFMISARSSEQFHQCTKQIRYIELGSAPMTADEKLKLAAAFPNATICMHYGLTEASRSTFLNFNTDPKYLSTVGKASPNVSIKIVDQQGLSVIGEPGTIFVSGNHVMIGYFDNPELTQSTLAEGWFNTGDRGMIDSEGYVTFLGREDDMINISGLKVSPFEIESIINRYPNVKESCAVLTAPTVITLFVVLSDPSESFDFANCQRFCTDYLEAYKIPRAHKIISVLPKTESGKLQRKKLLGA